MDKLLPYVESCLTRDIILHLNIVVYGKHGKGLGM